MDLDLSKLEGTELLGRFALKRLLGRGGYGAVFEGTQKSIGRRCAIKVLAPQNTDTDRVVKRFESEARAMSKLSHPNTIVIYDYGHDTEHDILFLAMEYLKGKDLRTLMQSGPLSVADSLHILRQIALSLDDAHEHGIVHRDVKPQNVMITARGKDKRFATVIDFGIAKALASDGRATIAQLTATGTIVGTPTYMSPEQIRNDDLDGRSDQYSVAVCAFKMLTGRAPFEGSSLIEVATKHITDTPPALREVSPRLEVDDVFEGVIARALSKQPKDRFDSIVEFVDSLKLAWLAGNQVSADSKTQLEMTEPLIGLRFSVAGPGSAERTTDEMTSPTVGIKGPQDESLALMTGASPPEAQPDQDSGVVPFTQSTALEVDGTRVLPSLDEPALAVAPKSAESSAKPRPWLVAVPILLALVVVAFFVSQGLSGEEPDLSSTSDHSAIAPSEASAQKAQNAPIPDTPEVSVEVPAAPDELELAKTVEVEIAAKDKDEEDVAVDSVTPEPEVSSEPKKQVKGKGKVKTILVPWGELYVDGKKKGNKTRQTLELREGRHRLSLRQAGKEKASKVVDVKAGETKMVTLRAQ